MSLAAYRVMEARVERCVAPCQGRREWSKGDGGTGNGGRGSGEREEGGGEGEEHGVGKEGREGFRGY